MEKEIAKFKRLERIRGIFLLALIFCGLIIIQMDLPSPVSRGGLISINKTGVYLAAVGLIFFSAAWNLFGVKNLLKKEFGFFFETVVYLFGITLVVSYTGGTYSLFNFLYFLPVLNVAANLNLRYSISASIIASILLSYQIISKQSIASADAFNLYLVNLFGIVLVTALGRFLVAELNIINKKQQELKIEQLQKLDKIKDEFVFIIAHELRSPITAIRGYLELINTDPKNKVDQNLNSLLVKSFATANKLASVVSMLLEVARLETGKISFYFQKIDVKNSVEFVVASLDKEVKEKGIQLTIDVPKENLILIDKERLEEILVVLLDNAIQFTPEYGNILISAQTAEKQVVLSIADSGVGIPAEMKNKMFDKLYTENTDSGEMIVKGYGVGLYVAKQLLLKMNGDINFESIVGKGTTFTLKLPKYWAFGK